MTAKLIDLNTERTKRMIEITYAQANNGQVLEVMGKLIKHVMPTMDKNLRLLQLVKTMELEIPKVRKELNEIQKKIKTTEETTPEQNEAIQAEIQAWATQKITFKYPKFTRADIEGAPLAALDLLLIEPILDETTFQ